MDISEIKDLINAISNSKIDIFDYEENGAKLHLEKKTEVEVIASPKPVAQDVLVKQENTEESIEQKEVLTGNVINSPLVGTVYLAPEEGAKPFVQVGDTVKKGQVVAIVEAMKLMNEIESEFDGVVTKVLVENDTCALLLDDYCFPAFRGKGFHGYLNQWRLNEMKINGAQKAYVIVLSYNRPAIRTQRKCGMEIEKVFYAYTFGKKVFIKGY